MLPEGCLVSQSPIYHQNKSEEVHFYFNIFTDIYLYYLYLLCLYLSVFIYIQILINTKTNINKHKYTNN